MIQMPSLDHLPMVPSSVASLQDEGISVYLPGVRSPLLHVSPSPGYHASHPTAITPIVP